MNSEHPTTKHFSHYDSLKNTNLDALTMQATLRISDIKSAIRFTRLGINEFILYGITEKNVGDVICEIYLSRTLFKCCVYENQLTETKKWECEEGGEPALLSSLNLSVIGFQTSP